MISLNKNSCPFLFYIQSEVSQQVSDAVKLCVDSHGPKRKNAHDSFDFFDSVQPVDIS